MIHAASRTVSKVCFSPSCYIIINITITIITCVGGNLDTHLWELTVWLSHDVVTCQLPSCFVFFYWEHDEGADSGGCRVTQTSCKSSPLRLSEERCHEQLRQARNVRSGQRRALPVDSELMRNLKCTWLHQTELQ